MGKEKIVIDVKSLSKLYRIGEIGRGTLTDDVQAWWAKIRGKEDPTSKIGSAKQYSSNKFYAISNLDLQCFEGEKIGIIGHNGAGKSTLLKLLCGIATPTEGYIKYNGKISSMLEVGTGFNIEMTGRENVYLNGTILGMSIREIDDKIEDIIEFSECRQFIDTPVKRYSSGMFVKLAFSVAAHLSNSIVIMDEVLAVGDAQFQQKCINKMTQIAKEDGKCVLFVSHNMQFIKQFCSRCIVMEKGSKIFDGDVDRAIDIYLDKRSSANLKYDLTQAPRAKNYSGALLSNFEMLDKVDVVFDDDRNEKFKLKIKYKILEDVKNVYVSVLVKHIDETLIGSVNSEYIQDYEINKEIEQEFEFDLRNIPVGKYFCLLRIMHKNEHEVPVVLDEPLQNISIVKYSSKGEASWPRTILGYTDLGVLEYNG